MSYYINDIIKTTVNEILAIYLLRSCRVVEIVVVVEEVIDVATLVAGKVTEEVTMAVDDVKPIICARLNKNVRYIFSIKSW